LTFSLARIRKKKDGEGEKGRQEEETGKWGNGNGEKWRKGEMEKRREEKRIRTCASG